MANYICRIRTNYFRVTDLKGFMALIDTVNAEYGISVWDNSDKNGIRRFCFSSEGPIYGIYDEENDEYSYDAFIYELQKFIPDDEAVLIFESGWEKLCYLTGAAMVVTNKDIEYLQIDDFALRQAQKMLGNPDYTTRCQY